MTPAGFEPTMPGSQWPQTRSLEGVVSEISFHECNKITIIIVITKQFICSSVIPRNGKACLMNSVSKL